MHALAALADPTRKKIVEMLSRGGLCSGDISGHFAASAPAISQHLRTLREAGLVHARVDGQRRIYELDATGLDEISDWLTRIRSFWAVGLGALESELERPATDRRGGRHKGEKE
jgi:DNA-binding transcriptional ArsR family regulator